MELILGSNASNYLTVYKQVTNVEVWALLSNTGKYLCENKGLMLKKMILIRNTWINLTVC